MEFLAVGVGAVVLIGVLVFARSRRKKSSHGLSLK